MISFFDENMPAGLARALQILGKDAHDVRDEPGLGPGTPDEKWIPYVAQRNWTVITQDRNIARRKDQLHLLKSHGVGAFIIVGKPQDGWSIIELVMKKMRDMEREASHQKTPFVGTIRLAGKNIRFL